MLTREAGTPLDKAVAAGRIQMASETALRVLFETTIDYLTGHGFLHYEISNFARRGADSGSPWQSRHNLKYWSMAPYIGLGPAAHSFVESAWQPVQAFGWKTADRGKRKAHSGTAAHGGDLPKFQDR